MQSNWKVLFRDDKHILGRLPVTNMVRIGNFPSSHITEIVKISINFLHQFKISYTKNSYEDFVSLKVKKAVKTNCKMNAKF